MRGSLVGSPGIPDPPSSRELGGSPCRRSQKSIPRIFDPASGAVSCGALSVQQSLIPDPALQQSRGVRALGGPQKIPRISDRFLRAQSCRVRAFGGPQDLCACFQSRELPGSPCRRGRGPADLRPRCPNRELGSPPASGGPRIPAPEQRLALTRQRVREGARSGDWRGRRPPLFRVPCASRGSSRKVAAARAGAAWSPPSSRRPLRGRRPRVRAARFSHFERREGRMSFRTSAPST